jgi:diguanylate cyclase (GGDEF)-like protein/hemerythrin-like metal-binding protein
MEPVLPKFRQRIDAASVASPLINSNLIALALVDGEQLLFANAAFDRLFGRPGGATNISFLELLPPADRDQIAEALRAPNGPPPATLARAFRGDSATFEAELHFERIVVEGEPLLAVFAQDVTDRFRAEAQLNLLAYSDPLTSLGNRAMFADRLRQAVLASRRLTQCFAVLVLDLDGFKSVNDIHGHEAGDLVLQRIAARLQASLRDTDTIVRLGGDEFAVLLLDLKARADAMTAADRLVQIARQPISLGAAEVRVGCSAGIAIFPEHASTVDQLLAAADKALYVAKRRGRGCAVWATAATPAESMPQPLPWNASYETGFRLIDAQHMRLMSLLNILVGALRNGEEHAGALTDVVAYTEFHFSAEERLMRQCGYAGAAAHRDLHRRLLEDLHGLRMDGAAVSVGLIARYLREWLLRHVDGADRDLAAALRAAGVE